MRQRHAATTVVCVLFVVLAGGCASQQSIRINSLHGPLSEVVRTNHLDQYHSWPVMNLPEGDDQGTTYYLDEGNLTLRFGDPPMVYQAEFVPSDKSAEQRYQEANAGWDKWVAAHTSPQTQPTTKP